MTLHKHELAEAVAELDAAIDWYADKRTLLAVEFLDAVVSSVDHIIAWPESGRPYPGREHSLPTIRTTRVKGFPYSIVYYADGDDLVIVAYVHGKLRPGYWKHRVQG